MPSITNIVLNDGTNNITFKPDSKEGPNWTFMSDDVTEVGHRSPLKVGVRTVGPDNGKRVNVTLGKRVIRTVEGQPTVVGIVPLELSIRRPGNITDIEYQAAVDMLVSGLATAHVLLGSVRDSEAFY